MRSARWEDLCHRLDRVWMRLAGLVSERHRLAADLVAAVERGEGATLLTWQCDESGELDCDLDDIVARVDEAVRRAPSPLGADELLLRVAVWSSIPSSDAKPKRRGKRCELIEMHTVMLDRYYDWLRGDALEQLRQRLEERVPHPGKPFVAVAVLPFGGAVAALLRDGPWQPPSRLMR